jgi:hypothetical protein
MSVPTPITIILANRPRLFRELLQHALNTAPAKFRVVEATDSNPTPSTLKQADWLIVDEESAGEAEKLTASHSQLGILVLEGRGSRARVLAPASHGEQHAVSEVPTLTTLFELLSQVPSRQTT